MHPVQLATHEWPASTSIAGATARVVVLVHGVTGWYRTWWRVGPALAGRGWRVIAVDQRGHGRSPRMDGRTTVAELAADLAATVEHVGVPVHGIVGHSLGGAVTAELAYTRPELMRRVVLEDPPAITRAGDTAWLENLERELVAVHEHPEAEVRRALEENPAWVEEDARQDVEGKQLADREGIVAMFREPNGARVLDIAGSLSVPALWLLGAEDRSVFPAEQRRRLEGALPQNARLEVLDAGHVIHRDRFKEYVELVSDWLAEA